MSQELIDFLHARYNEEEQDARDASAGGRWTYSGPDTVAEWTLHDEHWSIASMTTYDTQSYDYAERMPAFRSPAYIDPHANGRHIARWDPARVLAEIDAKRTAVEWCVAAVDRMDAPAPLVGMNVLAALALPYAGHTDYREEWKP